MGNLFPHNVWRCEVLSMVPLQLKGTLELSIHGREMFPSSRFLSHQILTLVVESTIWAKVCNNWPSAVL